MSKLFRVPNVVHNALLDAGFWLDEAESNEECAGYSRFTYDDSVYSFAVVDKDGVQCYSTHAAFGRRFAEGELGEWPDVWADGVSSLHVYSSWHVGAEFARKLAKLDAAVASLFEEVLAIGR